MYVWQLESQCVCTAVLGTLVVEVEAEDGTCGVGITIGGNPGCYIVEHHLSRFVEGEDPRNVELMWDKMWRSTINYGRKVGMEFGVGGSLGLGA